MDHRQAPLSMGFRLPFPFPEDLPTQGSNLCFLLGRQSFTTEPPRKPHLSVYRTYQNQWKKSGITIHTHTHMQKTIKAISRKKRLNTSDIIELKRDFRYTIIKCSLWDLGSSLNNQLSEELFETQAQFGNSCYLEFIVDFIGYVI